MYSILETHPASGRPTGRTIFSGTLKECREFMEDNPDTFERFEDEFVIKKGTLGSNTYTDERGFLQWNS